MDSLTEERELLEGDFDNPKHAAEELLAHLARIADYVNKNGIESPACVGIIARTFEMVCYRSPVVPFVDCDYHPHQMFTDGLIGAVSNLDMLKDFGFDEQLVEAKSNEHDRASEEQMEELRKLMATKSLQLH